MFLPLQDEVLSHRLGAVGSGPQRADVALRGRRCIKPVAILLSKVPCCSHRFPAQDEVLSHRLGLVPLAVDPNALTWRSGEDAAGEANTVVLRMAVRCSRAADGSMVNDKGELPD
jgi:hypothetical protein